LKDFLLNVLRLSSETTVQPIPNRDAVDVVLSYSCENFWSINVEGTGIIFTTFSDLISSDLFSTGSITAFYITVTVVVGAGLRSMFVYKGDRVFVVDSPNTDALINVLNAIYIARLEKNLKKEEEYFRILLEVLRSPELLK